MKYLIPLFACLIIGCTEDGQFIAESGQNTRGYGPANLVQAYFTQPGTERGQEKDTSLDDALIALLHGAKSTIDIAIYELKDEAVIDALLDAHDRGVTVRMVGDEDEASDLGYILLDEAGVEQSLRTTSGIMHNKFVVVDERVVWTGSTNLTHNGLYLNNNDAILLDSRELADEFTAEFEQMFVDGQFGGRKDDMNHTDSVVFNDGTVEFYFAPQHEPVEVMKSLLSEADHSALFMVFSMTHPELSDALIDLHADGVEVAGVLDKGQANPWYSKDEVLAEAGVPIYLDGNENAIGFAGGKLHHKALIVDAGTGSDPFVVTGSFNWSKSADTKNDENLIVIRDPQIVNAYKDRWCQMFTEGNIHDDYTGRGTVACIASDAIKPADL